jgi:hypothetical protein
MCNEEIRMSVTVYRINTNILQQSLSFISKISMIPHIIDFQQVIHSELHPNQHVHVHYYHFQWACSDVGFNIFRFQLKCLNVFG